ncbi:SlyX family protein [Polymorphum gilvum]|uniref:SlyX superfamily n=1 Tax=Polymorphum gilvum (strain LMG 25793 / CGMCC 1.9160 / SL003B-26A1) TaxID=991905 RepID=F2J044_POLGS|nr:SlyX family protein [Polymorphum gilvum]ADZ71879.1 SlyX superfamily [Polymorphum gilvum SL003B-26A1]
MSNDLDARVEKLEIDLAHAVYTIDEINAVVVEQARQIDRLTRRLADMTDRVEDLIETGLAGHRIDKPPHY